MRCRLVGSSRAGVIMCSLPEADDSSVFVVGTVLYRNLGSFLALQRWVTWEGESLSSYRYPVRDWWAGHGGMVGEACPEAGAGLQGWLSASHPTPLTAFAALMSPGTQLSSTLRSSL